MKQKDYIEAVLKLMRDGERTLFKTELAVGKLINEMTAYLDTKYTGPKMPRKKAVKEIHTGSQAKAIAMLIPSVKSQTGREYSNAWFGYCSLYASKFTDADVKVLADYITTECWRQWMMGLTDEARTKVLADLPKNHHPGDVLRSPSRQAMIKSGRRAVKTTQTSLGRVADETHNIILNPQGTLEELQFAFESLFTQNRDRVDDILKVVTGAANKIKGQI